MSSIRPTPTRALATMTAVIIPIAVAAPAGAHTPPKPAQPVAGRQLQQAINAFVGLPGSAPGIIVLTANGKRTTVRTAGVADVRTGARPGVDRYMRLASVSKALSGATALAVVAQHRLKLTDTIGRWLPELPRQWHQITLRQLLQHTSGIGDYGRSPELGQAVAASPQKAPAPQKLLSFAPHELLFEPGSQYAYSNSDNIAVALMVAAATHGSYEAALARYVLRPLGLTRTSLPRGSAIGSPTLRGYDVTDDEDITTAIAAGWSWASGGVVSTPANSLRFIRAYVAGALTDKASRRAQFTFRVGGSEPPGPGTNAAGLALFRYQTSCGTVYGHTGNTDGYTQFVAASADGKRAVTVSINGQITPRRDAATFATLRHIYELAVCATR